MNEYEFKRDSDGGGVLTVRAEDGRDEERQAQVVRPTRRRCRRRRWRRPGSRLLLWAHTPSPAACNHNTRTVNTKSKYLIIPCNIP